MTKAPDVYTIKDEATKKPVEIIIKDGQIVVRSESEEDEDEE